MHQMIDKYIYPRNISLKVSMLLESSKDEDSIHVIILHPVRKDVHQVIICYASVLNQTLRVQFLCDNVEIMCLFQTGQCPITITKK